MSKRLQTLARQRALTGIDALPVGLLRDGSIPDIVTAIWPDCDTLASEVDTQHQVHRFIMRLRETTRLITFGLSMLGYRHSRTSDTAARNWSYAGLDAWPVCDMTIRYSFLTDSLCQDTFRVGRTTGELLSSFDGPVTQGSNPSTRMGAFVIDALGNDLLPDSREHLVLLGLGGYPGLSTTYRAACQSEPVPA